MSDLTQTSNDHLIHALDVLELVERRRDSRLGVELGAR